MKTHTTIPNCSEFLSWRTKPHPLSAPILLGLGGIHPGTRHLLNSSTARGGGGRESPQVFHTPMLKAGFIHFYAWVWRTGIQALPPRMPNPDTSRLVRPQGCWEAGLLMPLHPCLCSDALHLASTLCPIRWSFPSRCSAVITKSSITGAPAGPGGTPA